MVDELVVYLRFRNQNLRAVTEGIALLDSNLSCAEVPDVTYGLLLVPLLKLNRAEEAMTYHQKGYPLNARNPGRLGAVIRHLEFLALTDNHTEAVKLLQKHLPVVLATVDLHNRFEFFRVARLIFERLNESGKDSVKLRLPNDFTLMHPDGHYQTASLASAFDNEAQAIALRFDARNGNDFYQRKLTELEKLKKCAIPFPTPRRGE